MQNFTYYTPTKVIFGKGEVERVGLCSGSRAPRRS